MTTLADPLELELPRASIADLVGTWIVAGTEPRRERRLVEELTDDAGIASFWPRETIRRRDRNGNGHYFDRKILRSLFPGYVFFCCREGTDDQYQVSGHRYVHSFLTTSLQDRLRHQLESLDFALSCSERLTVLPLSREGQRCEVTGGAFRGKQGELVRIKNERVFVIKFETLGQMVQVDIPPEYLEPL